MGKSALERAQIFLAQAGQSGDHPPRKRAAMGRHARKCGICGHPRRDAIEQDYLRWHSPERIAADYGLAHHSTVYRHLEAAGLVARRRATVRVVLDSIIERASEVPVTASSVIAAVRASACLTDDGKWIEPSRAPAAGVEPPPSNRELPELESRSSH